MAEIHHSLPYVNCSLEIQSGNVGLSFERWLGLRLELVGAIVILASAFFAVIGRGLISGSIVGLSISYALQVGCTSFVQIICLFVVIEGHLFYW